MRLRARKACKMTTTKQRKPRLSQTERNAVAFCEEAKKYGSASFNVRWIKSRTWGSNPSAECRNVRIGYASGCGYCKSSAVLASALHPLGETTEARHRIHATGGAGESAIIAALAAEGWTLSKVYDGKTEDGWRIERATVAAPTRLDERD